MAQPGWVSGVASGDADIEVPDTTKLSSDAESLFLEWRAVTRQHGQIVHEVGDTKTIRRGYL